MFIRSLPSFVLLANNVNTVVVVGDKCAQSSDYLTAPFVRILAMSINLSSVVKFLQSRGSSLLFFVDLNQILSERKVFLKNYNFLVIIFNSTTYDRHNFNLINVSQVTIVWASQHEDVNLGVNLSLTSSSSPNSNMSSRAVSYFASYRLLISSFSLRQRPTIENSPQRIETVQLPINFSIVYQHKIRRRMGVP